MAYTYSANLNLGATLAGLSLKAALKYWDGTTWIIHATLRDIATGFDEAGQGYYDWVTALMPDGMRGTVYYYTGTLGAATDFDGVVIVTTTVVSPQETENADVKTSTVEAGGSGAGDGSIEVDEGYGGDDALSYVRLGVPVDNATVRAYLKSDYDVGNTGLAYIRAETTTTTEGKFTAPLMLDPAVYTFVYFKQGAFGPDTLTVTVT